MNAKPMIQVGRKSPTGKGRAREVSESDLYVICTREMVFVRHVFQPRILRCDANCDKEMKRKMIEKLRPNSYANTFEIGECASVSIETNRSGAVRDYALNFYHFDERDLQKALNCPDRESRELNSAMF